ncbi:GNAT family N-acetyltransferase [Paenibacillus apiarius]|uniref:GNAT family N-acetyltransferase n=1 Tax=Paenibacillus apiarius TaxID=46240 RepID=A0ABT4DN46_9BACL|nr:GNAT family N-acetyltransferase [Paenibacillus apiarius]MCY9514670.1 GNAT family N-acetyltransferase [Paenibacillus apiarius]MCY9518660.1 GNAT family N-acetyltransferase [Paenibacillus apiarius]MCY9552899.1 GNAT family N-acetyltransferase [Paenibacillus apiarius]MCY9556924.1 GNAT family N-acetyltransferase [Paenibacillus apiarius]MCY9686123.1 GNAT family N-acetyltransferase [Paenibacillus apiarius]
MMIRDAEAKDAANIARVHVESWRTTYHGLVSDEFLSGLSIESRKQMWTQTMEQLTADKCLLILEDPNGQVVGFAMGGPSRSAEYPGRAELYALYLLEQAQGQGFGRKLVQAFARRMLESGFTSMLVWVLEGNGALHFYRRIGAEAIGNTEIAIGGERHTEIVLQWNDLKAI